MKMRRVIGSAPYGVIPPVYKMVYGAPCRCRARRNPRTGVYHDPFHDAYVLVSRGRVDKSAGYRLSLSCGHQQGSNTLRSRMSCFHCP